MSPSKTSLIILALSLPLTLMSGCSREQPEKSSPPPSEANRAVLSVKPGCQSCHPFSPDESHAQLTCSFCHNGDNQASEPDAAHRGLIARPAHPDHMLEKCGGCHSQAGSAGDTMHFTLKNEVNLVRRFFGADQDLATLKDIPVSDPPQTPQQLADDLLRRRCLRCHVYYEGDEYPDVRRGTGCASCHLEYENGRLLSHDFLAVPDDRRCLGCHYGNRVGSDYYGFFDHDFKQEYRTPYQPDGSYAPRPTGIERHQLRPDIHQTAGMTCVDCHIRMHQGESMTTIGCEACHLPDRRQPPASGNLRYQSGKLVLKTRVNKLDITVPLASDPAHNQSDPKASCTVCHAGWSFSDVNSHLVRIDSDDYGEWDDLFVQDSSDVEWFLLNSIYGELDRAPFMTDKITGKERQGLWLKGFRVRRWEQIIIESDGDGRLQTMRPVLDLHLSWLDEDGKTGFDSVTGSASGLRPYTPHTIGKAGAFYRQRLLKKDHPETQEYKPE